MNKPPLRARCNKGPTLVKCEAMGLICLEIRLNVYCRHTVQPDGQWELAARCGLTAELSFCVPGSNLVISLGIGVPTTGLMNLASSNQQRSCQVQLFCAGPTARVPYKAIERCHCWARPHASQLCHRKMMEHSWKFTPGFIATLQHTLNNVEGLEGTWWTLIMMNFWSKASSTSTSTSIMDDVNDGWFLHDSVGLPGRSWPLAFCSLAQALTAMATL